MSDKLPVVISEDDVQRILSRAAVLDSARQGLALDELRSVALAAGIRADAIEAAIDEFLHAERTVEAAPRPPRWKTLLQQYTRPLAITAAGIATGVMTWLIASGDAYGTDTLILGNAAILAGSVKLLLRARESGNQEQFQTELLLAWAGFAGGWSMARGETWGDMITVSALLWLVSAAIGAMALHVRRTPARAVEPAQN